MKELINLQLMMFALIITGLILKKVGVVGKEAQKGMTNLVIDLILPCNIIYSFMIKFSSKIAQDFVVILVISILIQVFCVILGGVLYNKCSVKRKKCLRYATICSNAGFLGNPIAQGVFGMMGLTLASIYLIPQRIMMWSEGVSVFTEAPTKKEMLKKIFTHPCIIACEIGIVLGVVTGLAFIYIYPFTYNTVLRIYPMLAPAYRQPCNGRKCNFGGNAGRSNYNNSCFKI